MNTTIFNSQNIADKLEETGWAVIDFCGVGKISNIKNRFEDYLPRISDMPVIITLLQKNRAVRNDVHREILTEFSPLLDFHFKNYKIAIALFFAKKANEVKDIGLHQDPMITDQTIHPSYGLWIPLVETNISNGTLCVLEKSHRWFHPFQSDTIMPPFNNIRSELNAKCISVNVKPGQAIIMDNRLIHNSLPNKNSEIRPVVVIKITNANAEYLTLYRQGESTYLIKNNENFYLKEDWITDKSVLPEGKISGVLDFTPYTISYDEFLAVESKNELNYYQTKNIRNWLGEAARK